MFPLRFSTCEDEIEWYSRAEARIARSAETLRWIKTARVRRRVDIWILRISLRMSLSLRYSYSISCKKLMQKWRNWHVVERANHRQAPGRQKPGPFRTSNDGKTSKDRNDRRAEHGNQCSERFSYETPAMIQGIFFARFLSEQGMSISPHAGPAICCLTSRRHQSSASKPARMYCTWAGRR